MINLKGLVKGLVKRFRQRFLNYYECGLCHGEYKGQRGLRIHENKRHGLNKKMKRFEGLPGVRVVD